MSGSTHEIALNTIVVIPTYNEADNLPGIIRALFALPLNLSVLVVDDNSPDGTGSLADEMACSFPGRVSVLHRPERLGLSSAYVQGFRCALEKGANVVGQMDADFSHAPSALIDMMKCLETCDVVFGSRYTSGGSVDGRWPRWRRALSALGNHYARMILRVPVRDITAGYRLWRTEALRGVPFDSIQSKGYVFQVEMAYVAHCLGYGIREMPVHFADRRLGKSKMSLEIQVEAALRVWQIWLTHRHLCDPGLAARARSELSVGPLP
jgi:dolichol-phosphate mannosyltransferase